MIGKTPTEMFFHFLNPFQTGPRYINIKAEGTNEHHKIEAIFKALQRQLRWLLARFDK